VYLSARSFGKKVRNLSNDVDIRRALTKFICWLIDEKSFLAVSNQNQMPIEKMQKCMSLTESSIIE
jgi:hypothetical protein